MRDSNPILSVGNPKRRSIPPLFFFYPLAKALLYINLTVFTVFLLFMFTDITKVKIGIFK